MTDFNPKFKAKSYLDEGAPDLNYAAGSLINVLDWAIQGEEWDIVFSGTNERVYRARKGNRKFLYVEDKIASYSVRVAGYGNMTSLVGGTDRFPKAVVSVFQLWGKSNSTSQTGQQNPYTIFISDVGIIFHRHNNNVAQEFAYYFIDLKLEEDYTEPLTLLSYYSNSSSNSSTTTTISSNSSNSSNNSNNNSNNTVAVVAYPFLSQAALLPTNLNSSSQKLSLSFPSSDPRKDAVWTQQSKYNPMGVDVNIKIIPILVQSYFNQDLTHTDYLGSTYGLHTMNNGYTQNPITGEKFRDSDNNLYVVINPTYSAPNDTFMKFIVELRE